MSLYVDLNLDVISLVNEFHPSLEDFADFTWVEASEMPGPYRRLLDHDSHMTSTVETYHGCSVNLTVLNRRHEYPWYSRQILLSRGDDDRVVQFGIVRLNVEVLDSQLCEEFAQERTPLGRILIQHKVLRRVRMVSLWRIVTGRVLTNFLELHRPAETYGRTAVIYCNGQRGIELLEIVAPVM